MSNDDTNIEETKDLARRSAIARILRRRHRRIKPRANSGKVEIGWAEYGPVTLTPSSDRSVWQHIALLVPLVMVIGFPFIIAGIQSAEEIQDNAFASLSSLGLTALFWVALIVATIAVAVVLVTSLWRIIAGNFRRRSK